jgi:hypothetical protein
MHRQATDAHGGAQLRDRIRNSKSDVGITAVGSLFMSKMKRFIGTTVLWSALGCGGADGPPAANPELEALYRADQDDRAGDVNGIQWSEVGPRDARRRQQVQDMLASGQVRVAADYFHAAMVLQHGATPADFRQAHELAMKAAQLDPHHKEAKWLAAAAKDRELMNLGKPQLYGTQFRTKEDGVWELYPVDPTITDAERAKWNVPPLAEAKKRVAILNGEKN